MWDSRNLSIGHCFLSSKGVWMTIILAFLATPSIRPLANAATSVPCSLSSVMSLPYFFKRISSTAPPNSCGGQPGGGEEGISDRSAEFFPNPESDASSLGNGHAIGLHQEMEGLHDQDGDAGDSLAEMPNMSPTILAQETGAGGSATEGPRSSQPRCGSPSAGYPAQTASLALSFSQGPAMNSAKGWGPHEASMDAWGRSHEKTSLEYILV